MQIRVAGQGDHFNLINWDHLHFLLTKILSFNFILFISFSFHFIDNFSGATHSKVVICDRNGSIISKVAGPGTNHWVLGIPEVARRIAEMIERAKHQANIEQTAPLRGLGLSLSGCEQVSDLINKTNYVIFMLN